MDCGTGVVGGPASAFLSGTDGCVDFAGEVAVSVMSPPVLAGDVAIGVVSPAVVGAAPCPTLLVMSPLWWLHWPTLLVT